jgi:hypothetical protein
MLVVAARQETAVATQHILTGQAVALQGTNALIGVPAANINGNEDQGKIYLFQRQSYEIFLPMVIR